MKEFNFTEKDLEPIRKWIAVKDTEMPDDEWEIAYFLDGYNFASREQKEKLQATISEMSEVIKWYNNVESYNLTHVNQDKGCATNLVSADHYYNTTAKRIFGGKKARDFINEHSEVFK